MTGSTPAGVAGLTEALTGIESSLGNADGAPERDFGGVVREIPRAVVEARSTDEVRRVFEIATAHDVPVVAQGTAHSVGGQSLIRDGLILRNRLTDGTAWATEDEIEVPTGLHWREVESQTRERGRAIPVLTSVLDLSVGGTLAVGGYGTATPRRGAQIDHVRGLELVTPNGETHWCSRTENEDLFRFSLAGVGQLGVITRVRLGTTPHRPSADLHGYSFPSISAMADALGRMEDPELQLPPYMRAFSYKPDRPGIVLFGALGHRASDDAPLSSVEGEVELERVREEFGAAETFMPAGDVRLLEDQFDRDWVDRYPDHLRLWVDHGFTYEGFRSYCRELERLAASDVFGKYIRAVYVSVVPSPSAGPDYFPLDIRPSDATRTFTCGVYCMVPSGDEEALGRARQGLKESSKLVAELGGRPYVYGFNDMGPTDWRRAFGKDALDQLHELKARVDPAGLIPPPWDRIDAQGVPDEGWPRKRRFRPGTPISR